MAPGWYSS